MRPGRGLAVGSVVGLALAVSGCGNEVDNGVTGGDQDAPKVQIYSSLPLRGPLGAQSRAMVNGMKLALLDSGGKIGDTRVLFKPLDDTGNDGVAWDDGKVTENARIAVRDRATVAYIGELDSGASALSIPILNEAGILQVSPSSTYSGLTSDDGLGQGEPDKYYPSAKRTFARVVPDDRVQAKAQVSNVERQGCRRLYILADQELYGTGLAREVEALADEIGVTVVPGDAVESDQRDFADLVADVVKSRADCFFFSGSEVEQGVALWRALGRAGDSLKLFGPDRLAVPAFASRAGRAAGRTFLTSPVLPMSKYPAKAREVLAKYRARPGYGRPDPRALYGYAAMEAVLHAIRDAGDAKTRPAAVVDSFFRLEQKDSVLGELSIGDDGTASLRDYGAYRIVGGKLRFDRVVTSK